MPCRAVRLLPDVLECGVLVDPAYIIQRLPRPLPLPRGGCIRSSPCAPAEGAESEAWRTTSAQCRRLLQRLLQSLLETGTPMLGMWLCVCVRACVRACVRVCVCVCE